MKYYIVILQLLYTFNMASQHVRSVISDQKVAHQ
jgi:hypothetical protein